LNIPQLHKSLRRNVSLCPLTPFPFSFFQEVEGCLMSREGGEGEDTDEGTDGRVKLKVKLTF